MKVKKLIELLQKVDPNREVIVASDAEGNGYSPLSGWWEGTYCKGNLEAYLEKLTPELEQEGYTESDVLSSRAKGACKAIFLCP